MTAVQQNGGHSRAVAVIGGGPAGLMAADILSAAGIAVTVFEAMPTIGRKFLLAGKSGLNIANSEADTAAASRYAPQHPALAAALAAFPMSAARAFADTLGAETFAGSSGRVFPGVMKASPLLRAWRLRLAAQGVTFLARHRWTGWNAAGELQFATPAGEATAAPPAVLFALGGASWPRLGSDGAWVPLLESRNIAVTPLAPANMGFDVAWSASFAERWAGSPVKSATLSFQGSTWRGEFVVTRHGVEGSGLYPVSGLLRKALEAGNGAVLHLDLFAGQSEAELLRRLLQHRKGQSLSTVLHKALHLDGVRLALLKELTDQATYQAPERLAAALKHLALPLAASRPLAEAISTAGGVALSGLDSHFMAKAAPGCFFAGEMLDWEAPTGGYLLPGCLATGHHAAIGILQWLNQNTAAQH